MVCMNNNAYFTLSLFHASYISEMLTIRRQFSNDYLQEGTPNLLVISPCMCISECYIW